MAISLGDIYVPVAKLVSYVDWIGTELTLILLRPVSKESYSFHKAVVAAVGTAIAF